MSKDGIDHDLAARNIAEEVTAAATAMASHFAPTPFLAVIAPAINDTLTLAIKGLFNGRARSFIDGYAAALGGVESASEHAKARQSEEAHQEALSKAFKLMMDAADPSVVHTLGYLAGQYCAAGKKPDGHFRNLGRVLVELEPGELDQLRDMLHMVKRFVQDGAEPTLDRVEVLCDGNVVRVTIASGEARLPSEHISSVPSGPRLLQLLRREGFAEDGVNRWDDDGDQCPRRANLSSERATQILRTIDP